MQFAKLAEKILNFIKRENQECKKVCQFALPKLYRLDSAHQSLELLQVFIVALSCPPVVATAELQ